MGNFILMADVKESRNKDSNILISHFSQLSLSLNDEFKIQLLSPLTITLGDEFQGIVDSLENAVKIIIKAEEYLIRNESGFKLRYVLNYGEIDTPVNSKIAYSMLGSGLTTAREELTGMKKSDERFLIITGNLQQDEQLNNCFLIFQNFIDNWKISDYRIVKEFIDEKDYKEVAAIIGFNPSNAWRREKSLKIKPYFASKKLLLSLV